MVHTHIYCLYRILIIKKKYRFSCPIITCIIMLVSVGFYSRKIVFIQVSVKYTLRSILYSKWHDFRESMIVLFSCCVDFNHFNILYIFEEASLLKFIIMVLIHTRLLLSFIDIGIFV